MNTHSKLLVIDDSQANRAVLSHILEGMGRVELADGGAAGLEIARRFRPDIVLLDIVMPKLDGYEVCRQLRSDRALSHAKIILISANQMASERLKGYEAGANDYVTRPFDADELRAKIRVYLRLKSLEEVEQVKECLIEVLQHTTRTPLAHILGYADLLREPGEVNDGTRREWSNVIHESATRLQRLFEKCETLVKMKSGQFPFEPAVVDLSQIVSAVIACNARKISQKKIPCTTTLPEHALCVGDRKQLERLIESVLDNAIRFSGDNGEIGVSIEEDDSSLHIRVSDSGPGIPAELVPYVFDALSNIESPLHNRGDCLSLCIGREIANAHNGTIEARVEPGSGTTIIITLPAHSRAERKAVSAIDGRSSEARENPSAPALSSAVIGI